MRNREGFAHDILSHLDEVVYILRLTDDPERSAVEYVSPRAKEITGVEPAAFCRDPELWWRLLHPEDVPAARDSMLQVLQTRRGCTRVYRLWNGNRDEYGWIEDRIVPLVGADGRTTGMVGAARDITERKLAEEALEQSRRRLRALSRRLVDLQEAERRHLARELHDDVGQSLTGLKLMLETDSRGACKGALAAVNDVLGRVRDISMGLRPPMLDDLGLVPALLWLFERFSSQAQLRVDFQHAGVSRRFSGGIEIAVFRIVQESLTNVARHAGVSEVAVRLWKGAERLGVRVEDRGRGFDPDAALMGASIGLAGMRERAESLGGQLTVESAPGSGARLSVELPLGAEGR